MVRKKRNCYVLKKFYDQIKITIRAKTEQLPNTFKVLQKYSAKKKKKVLKYTKTFSRKSDGICKNTQITFKNPCTWEIKYRALIASKRFHDPPSAFADVSDLHWSSATWTGKHERDGEKERDGERERRGWGGGGFSLQNIELEAVLRVAPGQCTDTQLGFRLKAAWHNNRYSVMSIRFGEAYNWLLKTAIYNFTATLMRALMPTRLLGLYKINK